MLQGEVPSQPSREPLYLACAYCTLSANQIMQGHLLVAHAYADSDESMVSDVSSSDL
ncbi:MAG: hypothetical protein ETSY1_08760 [Candidatus Entotheonella factor]|uniref:Uncharacterized protein n=1 Tax=Entotheonella factor TaxID=1429438 RepID=W4LSX1_ENTF1|nr:MAG: hypothetical protein ETSY1_08760 [Candidatus Entotheonella factor]